MKPCAFCGRSYLPRVPHQKTCSVRCRKDRELAENRSERAKLSGPEEEKAIQRCASDIADGVSAELMEKRFSKRIVRLALERTGKLGYQRERWFGAPA
jgi:hypothetical protein